MEIPSTIVHHVNLTLCVACYNEEANIVGTLDNIRAALRDSPLTWEAIVLDDASQDRTVDMVEQYIRQNPDLPIRLVVSESNRGLAQNFIEGAFRGRGEYYRLVCGDNTEDAETLKHVFRHVGADDLVTFYLEDARTFFRRNLSRVFTFIVNRLTGHRLRYYNGCAILRRYDVMRWHTNYHGFGFQADLICRLLDEGLHVTEVPRKAFERASGRSKALTLKNILSVSHTFMDLTIRRIGKVLFRRGKSRPRCYERLDLRALPPRGEAAAAPTPVASGHAAPSSAAVPVPIASEEGR